MKTWEYKRVLIPNTPAKLHLTQKGLQNEVNDAVEQVMNELGAQGWELVGMASHMQPLKGLAAGLVCIFKRPIGES